jgi:hypothetical protein
MLKQEIITEEIPVIDKEALNREPFGGTEEAFHFSGYYKYQRRCH